MDQTIGIIKLWQPEHIPVTPVGELRRGWRGGTYVYYVDESVDPTFVKSPGTVAAVDVWSSREGDTGSKPNRPAGFLWHGSQETLNKDFGGDEKYHLTAKEPAAFDLYFDNSQQLQRIGTSAATMVIGSTGIFKTYTFETEDSLGNPLTYYPTDALYVSDNYIWTKETFGSGLYAGYQVASLGTDEQGDYMIISNNF
jgi:hypothetical protein